MNFIYKEIGGSGYFEVLDIQNPLNPTKIGKITNSNNIK